MSFLSCNKSDIGYHTRALCAHIYCSSASTLLQEVFIEASRLVYNSFGYNFRYDHRHIKTYTEADCLFANFLRDVVSLSNDQLGSFE